MTRAQSSEVASRSWTVFVWAGAGWLLMAPLVAMQFTREMNWGPEDFLAFGAMLALACAALEIAVRLTRRPLYRLIAAAGIGVVFMAVWAELAVGIFR